MVNHHQIYDFNRSSLLSESLDSDPKDGDILLVPSFLAQNTHGSNITSFADPSSAHHYNTRSKLKAATTGRHVVVKTQVTHL